MSDSKAKPVVGVVGGIGSGKSTVAAELERLGCLRIDADRIGHELLADPRVRQEIRSRWGDGVFLPDGAVDRKALGAMVFERPEELAALNAILHPRIRRRMEQAIAAAQADHALAAVAIDAAVLFEAGWDDLCSDVLFVSAPDEVRARRVMESRGWDLRTWRSREKSQISLDSKAGRCYYSVDNCSSLICLQEQVRRVFCRIVHTAD